MEESTTSVPDQESAGAIALGTTRTNELTITTQPEHYETFEFREEDGQ